MPDIREIYRVKVFFEDNPSEFKIRPILIVDFDTDSALFTITEITSTQPKVPPTYHDRFKEPIINWRRAGLTEPSYVKTHKIFRIEQDKFLEFVGEVPGLDFDRILARIIEVNS
ncbi:MAG: type II toxin-antitoxin system PemK/MazF family toxin [Desulfitobacteriaceae bacterium]